MNTWEEIEQDPLFGNLTPEDKASLYDGWREKAVTEFSELDPEQIDPAGMRGFMASSYAKRKQLLGEQSDPQEWEVGFNDRAKNQQQMLRDYDRLETTRYALKDAENAVASAGMMDTYVGEGAKILDSNVRLRKQEEKDALDKFTPDTERQAKEAREAVRGERDVAILDGDIYTNPELTLDKDEYRRKVLSSDATPEAKLAALADFTNRRSNFAKESLRAFNIVGEAPIPGMDSFAQWEARQPADVRAKAPEDKALGYMREMRSRGWFRKMVSAIGTGAIQGGADVASQGIGVAAMATGSPDMAEMAGDVSEGSQAITEAQKLEGDMSATGATTAGGVARLGVGMAPAIGAALVTGGGLPAAALAAGAQTAGAQFPSTYSALIEQGKTPEEALAASRGAAVLSGAMTAALTAIGGASGVEALVRKGGEQAAKNRLIAGIIGAMKEIPEELSDELASQLIESSLTNPDKPVSQVVDEFAAQAPDLALQVGILGGAGELIRGGDKPTAATPEGAPVEMAPTDDAAPSAQDQIASAPVEVVIGDSNKGTFNPDIGMDLGTAQDILQTGTPEDIADLYDTGVMTLPKVVPESAPEDVQKLGENVAAAEVAGVPVSATAEALRETTAADAEVIPVEEAPAEEAPAEEAPAEEAPAEETPSLPVENEEQQASTALSNDFAQLQSAQVAKDISAIEKFEKDNAPDGTLSISIATLTPKQAARLSDDRLMDYIQGGVESIVVYEDNPSTTDQEFAQEASTRLSLTSAMAEGAKRGLDVRSIMEKELAKRRLIASKRRSSDPFSPPGEAPTLATEGTPTSGDVGTPPSTTGKKDLQVEPDTRKGAGMEITRDKTKPEQMTPEESYEAYTTAKNLAPNLADMPKTRKQIQEGIAIAENSGIKDSELQSMFMDSAKSETGQFAGPYIKAQRIRLIEEAMEDKKPVSAAAVDAYRITLPEGYVRQGDLYVFQPSSEQSGLGAGAATAPQGVIESPTAPEAGKSPKTTVVSTPTEAAATKIEESKQAEKPTKKKAQTGTPVLEEYPELEMRWEREVFPNGTQGGWILRESRTNVRLAGAKTKDEAIRAFRKSLMWQQAWNAKFDSVWKMVNDLIAREKLDVQPYTQDYTVKPTKAEWKSILEDRLAEKLEEANDRKGSHDGRRWASEMVDEIRQKLTSLSSYKGGRIDPVAAKPPLPQTTQAAAETQTPAPSRKGAGAAGVVERQPTEGSIPVVETTVVQTPPVSSAEKAAKAVASAGKSTAVRLVSNDGRQVIVARDPEDNSAWRATIFSDEEPTGHELFGDRDNAIRWVFGDEKTQDAEWGVAPQKTQSMAARKEASDRILAQLRGGGIEVSASEVAAASPKPKATRKPKARTPVTEQSRAPAPVEEELAPEEAPRPLPPKYKPKVGDLVSGKVNGVDVVGTVTEVSRSGMTTVKYGDGKEFVTNSPVPAAQALAAAPKYQYTQEQNAAKAARLGLPSTPGVTENAGEVIRNTLVNISKDTRLSPFTRAVARALLSVNFEGVRLRIKADARAIPGLYTHQDGVPEITVNLRVVARGQLDAIGIFLHEALHHATMEKLLNPAAGEEADAVAAIDKIVQHVRNVAGPDTQFDYELSNTWEFVSALFTNQEFQNYLATVPAPDNPTGIAKFRSVLSDIFRRLAQLVTGQKVQKGSTMEQAIAATMVLFETPQRTGAADVGSAGVPADRDAEYLAAVEAGDMEKAQRMVDEAAKAAGLVKLTFLKDSVPAGYYKPTTHKLSSLRMMEDATRKAERGEWGEFLEWVNGDVPSDMEPIVTTEYEDEPGVFYVNDGNHRVRAWQQEFEMPKTTVVPALTYQDSLDLVFEDESGNVIPLSQRFQSSSPDIRYAANTTGTPSSKLPPDKARAILTKRFGKAGAKFVVGEFGPDNNIDWDARIGDGNITLNLKYLNTEELLIAKAEHELAHAVFDDPAVQKEWKAISRTLSPTAREQMAARLKSLGYDDGVLSEEMLVTHLEAIRRNTPPAAWQRFIKAVKDALLRLFGIDVSQGDAERAAARIVAAGEAALARGLDPAVEAFGQSVVDGTRYSRVNPQEYNRQTNVRYGSERTINLRPAAPQQETANKASAIIGEAIAKDPVNGRMNALLRFDSDTSLPLEVRAIGAAMLAEQVEHLNALKIKQGKGTIENTDRADDFVDRAISIVQRLGTELGRGLNIFNAFARLTPEGFIRRQMRQHAKGVDEAIRQNFEGDLRGEIERLWKMMQEAGNTPRGEAFAAALKAFMPRRVDRKKNIESMFKSAGFRERMAQGGESLVRDFFQMMAGPRAQAGPLAEFDSSIQSALSTMLRKVMEEKGLVADNQSVQATDIDKLVRSVSSDALRFEKIAAADAAMQDELDKIDDPERRVVLQQAWEEATAKMYTNIASEATLRRAVNAQLKETPVEWAALYDKNKGTDAEKSRVVAAVMSKVEALLTDADDKGVKANMEMLRSEVAEAFDQVAAIKRSQWLASREAIEARRRTAERRAAFVEALKVKGISEKALADLNAKLNLPPRPGAERNEVSVLIGDNLKKPVDDFVTKLTALGVDQNIAEEIDKVSTKLRVEYAEAARIAAIEALKLVPTKLTQQAIERINKLMAGPMQPHVKGEVATLISDHTKAIVPDFVERMVALGVERKAAEELNDALKVSRVDRFLASLLKVVEPRNKTAKEKLTKVVRTILEAGKLGATDSQQFMDLFAKEFGLPPMTKEFRDEIKQMVREINALPKGPARIDAMQALEEKLALWEGIKTRDVLMSVWYANILSGVSTQAVGLLYNNLNLLLKSVVTMLANPRSAKAFVKGALGEGLRTGLKEAGAAMQGRGLYKVSKWGDKSVINGLELLKKQGPVGAVQWAAYLASAGTFTRRVFHLMAAVDALAWNTAREGHAYLAANRALREELAGTNPTAEEFNRKLVEKLGGDAAQIEADMRESRDQLIKAGATPDLTTIDRMARQMRDDRRGDVSLSNRFADRVVVQQEPEGIGRLVSALISAIQKVNVVGVPVGQLLVPFNKIVSNLFEQALDYTPVGVFRGILGGHLTDVESWGNLAKGEVKFREKSPLFDTTERWERGITGAAATAIGFLLYALAASMMDEDDEDVPFMIYAFGPSDKNKRSQMPKGWAPFTVKIFGVYYRYAEAPFGMMFAGIGSVLDAMRYEKMEHKSGTEKLTYIMMHAAKGFMTQGVLSSVDTALDVAMFKASDKKFSDIPVAAAKGAIPLQGLLRDISTLTDDRKIDGSTMKAALLRDIPWVKSYAGKPELNAFGEPVTFDGLPVVRRFLTGIERNHVSDYLGRNDLYIPGMDQVIEVGSYLPKDMKDRLKRRALEVSASENGMFTKEQAYNFKKRAGELTKVAVQKIMAINPPITNDVQRKNVQNLLNRQIEIARKRAMLEAVPIK